jgi:hypothetical protein
MDVGFEAQVTAVCVDSVDHTDADTGIQLIYQFTDDPSTALRTGLGTGFQEDLESGAVFEEARPQQVVGGEGDVEVRDFEEVAGDVVNPIVDAHLAAGGAEAGFAGEGDEKLVLTARANIASVATVRVATEHQALDDLIDVGPLIWGAVVL